MYGLAVQLEAAAAREREARALLHRTHLQLADRDEMIGRLTQLPEVARQHSLERERDELSAANADLNADRERLCSELDGWRAESERLGTTLTVLEAQLTAMQATRAWRAARQWWRVKATLRGN